MIQSGLLIPWEAATLVPPVPSWGHPSRCVPPPDLPASDCGKHVCVSSEQARDRPPGQTGPSRDRIRGTVTSPNPASLFLFVQRPSLCVSQKNREDEHVVTRGSYFEGDLSVAPGGGSGVATLQGIRWPPFLGGHAVGSELWTQPFKLSRARGLRQCGPGSGSCTTRPQRRE